MSSSPGLYLFFFIKDFFISLFSIFCQFRSKTMWEFILKVRQYRICNGKEAKLFYFFKVANTPRNGTIRHIAWSHLSSFLFKIQCFYWDNNNLDPDDQHWIRRKRNNLCLATFLKNDNSSCLLYTSSFDWKSTFVLIYYKSEDGYPNFFIFLSSFDNSVN